ncbi:gamma-glutamylcyclotransferase [Geitlerinema sp. PCC 7407]|uniref:gamma-glutamylcyclotransferase family protein n=1 Tax=Geitlerinema sp. PCC 7407 TaxID=1173025 RepID=UPI00029FA6DC|nr:AIG2 family protein [Geitlerinema sp. PCC 7407]
MKPSANLGSSSPLSGLSSAASSEAVLRVFVYGTLKPGESNYRRYCEGKVLAAVPAIARGQLFHLCLGYPGMSAGNEPVYGVVLSFGDRRILEELDRLEDYDPQREPADNEYQRCQIEVTDMAGRSLGTVWTYQMSPAKIRLFQGIHLPEGVWASDRVSAAPPQL